MVIKRPASRNVSLADFWHHTQLQNSIVRCPPRTMRIAAERVSYDGAQSTHGLTIASPHRFRPGVVWQLRQVA